MTCVPYLSKLFEYKIPESREEYQGNPNETLRMTHSLYISPNNFLCQYLTYAMIPGSAYHDVQTYTYKDLKKITDDFSYINKIGQGGFGSVYKVIFCFQMIGAVF